jgi:site-specific DNA recombinase
LRSYVWCTACARRMIGREVFEYTYYTCRPRDRVAVDGHPRTLSLHENTLLDLTTRFFNTHILGPQRVQLVSTSANIAAQQAVEEHLQRINAVRYALADIEGRQNRLFKILEERDDPDGRLYKQAQERQAELDADHAHKMAELEHLEQTMPSGGAGALDLLTGLPELEIDLAALPVHRLRPLLDAFAIQLHYNLPDNSIRLEATISAEAVPHLAGQAHHAGGIAPNSAPVTRRQRPRRRARASVGAVVPADDGGDRPFLRFCDMPRRGHKIMTSSCFYRGCSWCEPSVAALLPPLCNRAFGQVIRVQVRHTVRRDARMARRIR